MATTSLPPLLVLEGGSKLRICAAIFLAALIWQITKALKRSRIPSISVDLDWRPTARDSVSGAVDSKEARKAILDCCDPATAEFICHLPAMTAEEVAASIERARGASQAWRNSSFQQRRLFLRILLKFISSHQEEICRVAAKDSGKPMVDAAFGEVMVTCEKLTWLLSQGQGYLKPEKRAAGALMFYKTARVEYHPIGVVRSEQLYHGTILSITSSILSQPQSLLAMQLSSRLIARIRQHMIGAPADLVQLVTGYGEAGAALVRGRVDKLIFVGSTQVGRQVMVGAAERLTPLTLELGGKDAFIVCADADLRQTLPTALRGAFQSCGQNCAGAERFIVHAAVYDAFCSQAAQVAARMRQGPPLGGRQVDAGAMCLPGLAHKVAQLVDDAVAQGAELLAGGRLIQPEGGELGQYYAPTVLKGVRPGMRIWQEEVFGPVMAISRCQDDDEAVRLANDCAFGLGSAVFSRSQTRAHAIASQLQVGMSSINDFATTYMCQSLPFGGVKESGFGRFAGVEGLRALCIAKAICDDRAPWLMKTTIPPLLQYPVGDAALQFTCGLIGMFYAPELIGRLRGLLQLLKCFLPAWLKSH